MAKSSSYYQASASAPNADGQNKKGAKVRAQAAELLYKVLYKRQSLDSLLESARSAVALRDQGLFTHLVQGVLRWHLALESLYSAHLESQIKPKDQIVYALLSIGVYQARVMHQPDYVAINTTVDATKLVGKPQLAGLVNAVLRRTLAANTVLPDALLTHPEWLVDSIYQAVNQSQPELAEQADPADRAAQVVAANDRLPTLWLRILPADQADVLARFKAHDITLKASTQVDSAFALMTLPADLSLVDVLEIGGAGVSVQDISAQVLRAVIQRVINTLPSQAKVLDACAAPGGKTALMAQSWTDWQITAVDQSAQRLSRLQENLNRLTLSSQIAVQQADLLDKQSAFYTDQSSTELASNTFDLIVLDAPCSAIGVLRRHPDIKHLRVPKTVARAQQQQQQLLANLWQYVRPGGYLIYVTCSYLLDETQAVIEPFLQTQQNAAIVPLQAPYFEQRAYGSIIFPDTLAECSDVVVDAETNASESARMDGFFYALLHKSDATPSNTN